MKRTSISRYGAALIIAMLAVLTLPAVTAAAAPTRLLVNGEDISAAAAPFVENGRTMVPLRIISEKLACEVSYTEVTKMITLRKEGTVVLLRLGENTAQVNNNRVGLDATAKAIKGKTYVPLRFISESMRVAVNWDSQKNLITVGKRTSLLDTINANHPKLARVIQGRQNKMKFTSTAAFSAGADGQSMEFKLSGQGALNGTDYYFKGKMEIVPALPDGSAPEIYIAKKGNTMYSVNPDGTISTQALPEGAQAVYDYTAGNEAQAEMFAQIYDGQVVNEGTAAVGGQTVTVYAITIDASEAFEQVFRMMNRFGGTIGGAGSAGSPAEMRRIFSELNFSGKYIFRIYINDLDQIIKQDTNFTGSFAVEGKGMTMRVADESVYSNIGEEAEIILPPGVN